MKGKKYKSVLYTVGDPIVLRNKVVEGVFIEDIKNACTSVTLSLLNSNLSRLAVEILPSKLLT